MSIREEEYKKHANIRKDFFQGKYRFFLITQPEDEKMKKEGFYGPMFFEYEDGPKAIFFFPNYASAKEYCDTHGYVEEGKPYPIAHLPNNRQYVVRMILSAIKNGITEVGLADDESFHLYDALKIAQDWKVDMYTYMLDLRFLPIKPYDPESDALKEELVAQN